MSGRHSSASAAMFYWSRSWTVDGYDVALAAVTGRDLPGRSAAGQTPDAVSPYGSGNLGLNVQDDPAQVQARRATVAAHIAVAPEHLLLPRQVHGCDVATVDGSWQDPPEVDALVTATPGLALGVTVADCVPVMLVDAERGIVGVAHAGRRGMASGVTTATLDAMADLGATTIDAVLGPSICPRCYEVSAEVRDVAAAAAPVSASLSRYGTPAVDVAAGVLAELGPRCRSIDVVPGCTAERTDLFSYRRDRLTGRFAGLVLTRPR